MPSITPLVRASIGGNPEETFRQPRMTVKAQTGMNLPPIQEGDSKPPAATGQTGTIEDTSEKAVTLSPQLTALARKQQKLQADIQALREKEAALAAKEADFIPRSSFKAKLRENAVDALKDLGLDYNELTELLLNQQNGTDPVKKLEAEINQLKSAREQDVNKQYDATLRQYKAEANSLINSDPKKFYFIQKEGAVDAVVQHIVETWKEDENQVLSVDEAAKDIEEFLRDEAKKKKALLDELEGPPAEQAKPSQKTLPPPQKSGARTLTQSVETAPTRTYGQFQHLSEKERIAQAIARARR